MAGGRGGDKGRMYDDETERTLVGQNETELDELNAQLERIKSVSVDIRAEVEEQNSILDGMADAFGSVQTGFNRTMDGLSHMMETGNTKQMLRLAIALFFALWVVYYLAFHANATDTAAAD